MDFLKACAARLDEGETASDVMADMRAHYSTVRCLSVKTCLVRQLCKPSPDYRTAADGVLSTAREDATLSAAFLSRLTAALKGGKPTCRETRPFFQTLPPYLPENARQLKITREEMRACKREGARKALEKNRRKEKVDGCALLDRAREHVALPDLPSFAELALALMLVTGRRSCEILNGRSTFAKEDEYALRFAGQAKKRRGETGTRDEEDDGEPQHEDEQKEKSGEHEEDETASHHRTDEYVVPTLAPADAILSALEVLRVRQRHAKLGNRETSRRYQSLLSRTLLGAEPWKSCKRAHSLRGVYACMALRLFDWGEEEPSEAYVAMCLLGHAGLQESLVYTPFALGKEFATVPSLGRGRYTPWEEETTPETRSEQEARPPAAMLSPTW